MSGNKAIPGYRYDSRRNRYFIANINESTLEPLSREQQKSQQKKLKEQEKKVVGCELESNTTVSPQLQWHHCIRQREEGRMKKKQFETNVKLKTIMLGNVDESDGKMLTPAYECIYLASPSEKNAIVGVWKSLVYNRFLTGITRLGYTDYEFPCTDHISCCNVANINGDLCLMIAWDRLTHQPGYPMPRSFTTVTLTYPQLDGFDLYRVGLDTAFSCAYSDPKKLKALGLEKRLILVTATNSRAGILQTNGSCTALEFNKSGSHLFAGTRTGYFYLYDGRRKTFATAAKVLNSYISNVNLVKNEHQVVCGGYNNNLVLMDIRKLTTPVVRYEQHVNTSKNLSVTVDDDLQLICAAGEDTVTRIWDINKPQPIKKITLPEGCFGIRGNRGVPRAVLRSDWANTPVVLIVHDEHIHLCSMEF
ncbi:DDB1- and CUL4-associated factor 4 [Chamberlinius hualienensis]